MKINRITEDVLELAETIGNYQGCEEFTRDEIKQDILIDPLSVLLWVEDVELNEPEQEQNREIITDMLKGYIKFNEL